MALAEDFEVLAQIATFLDERTEVGKRYRFATVLDEFRITIQNELIYEWEAQRHCGEKIARLVPGFLLRNIRIPLRNLRFNRMVAQRRGRIVTWWATVSRIAWLVPYESGLLSFPSGTGSV